MGGKGSGGGNRGAGRKRRHHDELLVQGVRLTRAQTALLRLWGGGNVSAGLRWLIAAAAGLIRRDQPGDTPASGQSPGSDAR